MPIYEYACTSCGERTEAKQSFDDPPLEECLVCGGRLRKLFSPVGIVFKGTGFYATDAKRAAGAGKSSSDSGKDSAKDSESSGSKDSKGKGETTKSSTDKEKSA